MKPENQSENSGALSALLRAWKLEVPLPPHFDEQVWQRIARAEHLTAPPWDRLRNQLAQLFARPAWALAYVTVLLVAGLLAGSWQAHLDATRTAANLSARYVQMVDPYQTPPR
jgi:hypothetical protein